MSKNVVILLLSGMLIWFGAAVIRLENQRYALDLEVCGRIYPADARTLLARDKCLERVQTRTSQIYHLLYGLKIL